MTELDRWQAVQRRDPAADGAFYYSVRTTGVYCRPSCASRQARRDNVAFHLTRADAERAGFRPCRRCRPHEAPLRQRHAGLVAQACRVIEAAETPPALDTLAGAAGLSRFHFHRLFRQTMGVTPKAYADAHRARRLREALAGAGTITGAAYECGFNSSGRFYATARDLLGMTPTQFAAQGSGMTIKFAVGACSLGAILVAATDKGVCAILLGDDPGSLVRDLQDRFARAQLSGGDAAFERWVAQVVACVEQPARAFDVPLDVRGTAFQHRVWQALRAIPAGSTASYAEIGARIGQPQAARAVAQACGANPVAVAIPCHRVVRTDGALSGYRWGVERKRALLAREAADGELDCEPRP